VGLGSRPVEPVRTEGGLDGPAFLERYRPLQSRCAAPACAKSVGGGGRHLGRLANASVSSARPIWLQTGAKWYNNAMTTKTAYSSQDEVPRTQTSAIAILDILGFKTEVLRAHSEGHADKLLARLKAKLDSWYSLARDNDPFSAQVPDRGETRQRFWEVKAFTDNVVIGMPVWPRREEQTLNQLLTSVVSLQRGLVLDGGFFLRGGIAFGDLYIDDDIVYGKGLLDAYCAERDAIVPRVVLHSSAADLIPDHARCYSDIHRSPQYRTLLRDEDERFFINYLSGVVDDDYGLQADWLERHRDLINCALDEFRADSRILAKYLWAARFHNYICKEVEGADDYKLDLNTELVTLKASAIIAGSDKEA